MEMASRKKISVAETSPVFGFAPLGNRNDTTDSFVVTNASEHYRQHDLRPFEATFRRTAYRCLLVGTGRSQPITPHYFR
jgi:hypothetical protein